MKRKTLSLAIACTLLSPLAWGQDAIEPAATEPAATTPEATDVAATASTQDSPQAATNQASSLGTVKVTARKREETLQEVPVAVTAFTADALEKLNVNDISDIGSQVPNLTIYAARGSSSTVTAYIRGVGQSDPLWGVDPGVGIYLDDVYIARPQGALLDVFDVDRIEVLRGPQGTLYGKNTIGGAIKYISRALSKETTGFVEATVGNYNERNLKAAIGGSLGGDGTLRGRVAIASLNRDGFGENLITGEGVSNKQINAFRLNLGAYFTDDFDIQFAYDRTDDRSGIRGSKMLAPNPFTPTYPPLESRYDVRNGMPNINDTLLQGISATANYRANDDWSFKYIVAKRESDTETNIDFDNTPLPIADVKGFYSDQQVSNEVQANYDAGGRSRGVMGVYIFDARAGGQVLNNFFGLLFGDTQGTVYTKSYALYADWTFDLTEKWQLDVGARYTDEDKHAVVLNRGYSDGTYTTPTADRRRLRQDRELQECIAQGFAQLPGHAGHHDLWVGIARLQVGRLQHSRADRRGAALGRAVLGRVRGQLRDRQQDGLPRPEPVLEPGVVPQQVQGYPAVGIHCLRQQWRWNVDDAFFGDFSNAGSGTVNGAEIEYQWMPGAISRSTATWPGWIPSTTSSSLAASMSPTASDLPTPRKFSGAINMEYRSALASGGRLVCTRGLQLPERGVPDHRPVRGHQTGRLWLGQRWHHLEYRRCVDAFAAGHEPCRQRVSHHRIQHPGTGRADRFLWRPASVHIERPVQVLMAGRAWTRHFSSTGWRGRCLAVKALG